MKKRCADEMRYKKYIKSLPCVHCKSPAPNTWHHAIGYGSGRMAGKAFWMMTMPMCGKCHADFHHELKTGDNGFDGAVKAQLRYIEDTLLKAFVDGAIKIYIKI